MKTRNGPGVHVWLALMASFLMNLKLLSAEIALFVVVICILAQLLSPGEPTRTRKAGMPEG